MLGIRFIKFDAMTYVIHYKKGRVAREGRGLAFYYYEPSSSIAAIPLGSNDVPFIFNEQTQDYQTISVQGQVSYRVKDAKKLAEVLDFTVDADIIFIQFAPKTLHVVNCDLNAIQAFELLKF